MAEAQVNRRIGSKNRSYAKSVGSFVPALTRKSFEKYGFSTATLLTDWAMIVGADLASFTLPERLKWPRGVEAFAETEDADRGRPGATLVLRVDGPRAIDVQYQSAQIIERINAHFGYRAVSTMRFVQAPIAAAACARSAPPVTAAISNNGGARDALRPALAAGHGSSDAATINERDVTPLLAALDRLHANMTRPR